MIKSMTGFGRGESLGRIKQVTVEVRTVNHRYNEIQVRMPRQYSLLEEQIKRFLLNKLSRGRIEVYVRMEETGDRPREVRVDKELAIAYYKALKDLAEITQTMPDVGVLQIAQLPEVLKIEEPEENLDDIWQDIAPAIEQAGAALLEMRRQEGLKLKEDLDEHLDILQKYLAKIEGKAPRVVDQYREKLQNRLAQLLENGQVDENRLAVEVALFADKSSIAEELVRLSSHFTQFGQALRDNNPVGRKLDFILQEMNREVNTIGSKANDLEITQCVVEMKNELEKLREQVQNIE